MAQERELDLRELTKVKWIYLMSSYERCEVACEVLEVLEDCA